MTYSSWEHASSLPQTMVKEFEDGIVREVQKESMTSGSEIIHMISTHTCDPGSSPKPKRFREDHDKNTSNNSGYVYIFISIHKCTKIYGTKNAEFL